VLELSRRIGTEFGIHIVLSSHLLEEVEQVCDAVVILSEGRVVAQGTLDILREGDGAIEVEFDGDASVVASRLESIGLTARETGRVLVVEGDPDLVADAVRDAAAALDIGLRRIVRQRVTLE